MRVGAVPGALSYPDSNLEHEWSDEREDDQHESGPIDFDRRLPGISGCIITGAQIVGEWPLPGQIDEYRLTCKAEKITIGLF
jgi:hypothetical protein